VSHLSKPAHARRQQRHRQRQVFERAKTCSRVPIQNGDDDAFGNVTPEVRLLIENSRRCHETTQDHAVLSAERA